MERANNRCIVCGSGGFWRNFFSGVRRMIPFRGRREVLERIPVAEIADNPFQPRTYIRAEPHDDLKMSIAQFGVIVPVIVNRRRDGGFTLVAGQRRLQAARELGLETIPAIIRRMETREMMEVTYLENLHREDLGRADVVQMFDRILKKYPGMAEEELAVAMGLDAAALRQARELLDLPIPVLEAVRAGMVTEGQGRWIAQLPDPESMLEAVEMTVQDRLDLESTRAMVERMLRRPPRFVSNADSPHYHSPSCPFAQFIPAEKQARFYSKKEARRRGKIACMQCL